MSPPPFSIRAARAEDAAAIAGVHCRAIFELARGSYSAAELDSWAHELSADFYRPRIEETAHFEVAVDEHDAVVGFAATRDDEMWLLYVEPEWANRGVGSALLRRAEDHLRGEGHRDIWVQSSLNAEGFYATSGYELQSTIDAATRGGKTLRARRMTKTLAPRG